MNQEYVSTLERIVHSSNINMVKVNKHMKDLLHKQKKLQDGLKILQNDNIKLKHKLAFEQEKYMCNVCFQEEKDCIIKPCNHFAGCKSCCSQLNICPICRTEIKSYTTLFIT